MVCIKWNQSKRIKAIVNECIVEDNASKSVLLTFPQYYTCDATELIIVSNHKATRLAINENHYSGLDSSSKFDYQMQRCLT